MSMDEEALRAVLERIAADPEPPARISIDTARRRGRRFLLVRRTTAVAAGPLAIALAAGIIVTAPHALFSRPERSVPSAPAKSSAPATTVPAPAPASFNPLVPYAAFGWLPSGFSEGAVSPLWTSPFQSGTTSLTLGAQDTSGRTLLLTVNTKGGCPPGSPDGKSFPGCVTEPSIPGVSRAPDVSGRLAWYTQWGSSITWEYARGAWATLDAGIAGQLLAKPARSAEQGWTVSLAAGAVASAEKLGLPGPASRAVALALKDGKLIPPSPQTKAMLLRVASAVKYGQKTPIAFPFRLARGALPAGWKLTSASFRPSGGTLVGSGIGAGPAADSSALSVGAARPDGYGCDFVKGQSSYVSRDGVFWIDRIIGEVNKDDEILCSTGSAPAGLVDGLQVFIYLETNLPGSGSLLPGTSSLGDAFGVYSRMEFLGADPSDWTTDPLG